MRGQVQPEDRDRALDPGQQAVGDQLAGVGAQRVADQRQLGEQLARCRGSRGPGTWAVPASTRRRVFAIFAVHAGQLQPVRLGGVELDDVRIQARAAPPGPPRPRPRARR